MIDFDRWFSRAVGSSDSESSPDPVGSTLAVLDPTARRERDALALTAGAPPAEPPFSAPAGASTPVGASDLDTARTMNGGGQGLNMKTDDPSPLPGAAFPLDPRPNPIYDPEGVDRTNDLLGPGPAPAERWPALDVPPTAMYRQPLSQQPELPPDLPLDPDQGPHELIPPGAVSAPPIISPLAPNENPGVSTTAALPAPPQIEITQGGPPTPSAQWTPVETRPLPQPAPPPQVVEQSTPWPQIPGLQPVLDAAGNVVAWVQGQAQAAGQQISENMAGNRQAVEEANIATGAPDAPSPLTSAINTVAQTAEPFIQPMADTPYITSRINEIQTQAAAELGRSPIDVRVTRDLGWRARHPDLAEEYDQLQDHLTMALMGQVGDMAGPARNSAEAVSNIVQHAGPRSEAAARVPGVAQGAARGGVEAAPTVIPSTVPTPGVGSRIRGALDANAERVAAVDARAAERGSTVAPGVFGVSGIEPNRPDVQGMRPRVIPPNVADELDFPVRVPTDPSVVRAIEAAGGTVDERGVTLGVTRAQSPTGAGQSATRGMVFYEAVPEGGRSSFVAADDPKGVGGSQVIPRTPTRFRSPLILNDAPGGGQGLNEAMQQFGHTDHPDVVQARQAVHDAYDAVQAAYARSNDLFTDEMRVQTGMTRPEWNRTPEGAETSRAVDAANNVKRAAERRLQETLAAHPPATSAALDSAIREARASGPEGSPARAQALKDLVARYGGEPELIDDLLAVRGADASESAWAIKENIVATNARKQGYDGVVTVRRSGERELLPVTPEITAAKQAHDAALRAANDAHRAAGLANIEHAAGEFRLRRGEASREELAALAQQKEAAVRYASQLEAEKSARLNEYTAIAYGPEKSKITELADTREARNPTPGEPTAELKAAYRRAKDAEAKRLELQSQLSEHPANTPEKREALRAANQEARESSTALDALMNETATPPGYTLRPDIPRRGPVRESTIEPNPRTAAIEREYQEALAEHGEFYEQYMREAPGETFIGWARQSGNKAALDADTRLTKATYAYDQLGMSNEGRYVTAQASAGTLPASPSTDRLGAVNRVLGQGVASAVSGGVGAQVNQEMNPDDPYAGVKGFAVGALAPTLIARGARRVARAAGRDADGLLATFGVAPGSPIDPARVAAAAAEGPTRGAQLNRRLDPSGASIPLRVRAANAWTDDQAILRWAEDLLTQESGRGKLPEDAPERASTLRRRNPDSYTDQRIRDELAPVVGRARKEGLLDELTQYLQDTHERDVLAEFYTRGHEGATAAGKSAADADAEGIARMRRRASANADLDWETVNARLEGQKQRLGDQFDTLDELAQGVWDHNRTTLDRMLESGRISKEQHAWLSETYPHYVPTVPISHLDPGGGKVAVGHGSGISAGRSGPGDIKAFEDVASGSDRLNPIIASRDATIARERVAQKNEAFQAFARMYDDAMQSGSATTQASQGARRQVFAGEVEVSGRVDGEPTTIRVPKPVAEAIDAMSEMGAGDRMPAIWRAAMSAVTTSITGRRAAFLPVNLARDFGDSLIRAGATYGPQAIPEFLARWFAQAGNAAADLAVGAARGRLEVTGDATTYLRRGGGMGRAEGGWQKGEQWYDDVQRTGGVVFTNPQAFGSVMRDLATFKPIMAANERTELISRTAMMQMAEKRGAGPTEAMIAGRNASVDFNRAGTLARMLNSGIPFFNATVQGGAQLVRTLRDHPKSAAATLATVVGLPVAAAEAYNRSDPQRAQAYDDVPQYLKDQGIVVMLPWAGSDNRGERPNYLWLPLGMGAPVAVAMREAMRDMPGLEPASGRSDLPSDASDWQGWASVAEQVFGMLSPIKGESAAGAASSLIPPGAKQLVELGTNNNLYTGGTIASDTADERASAFGQGVADVANTAGRAIGSDLLQEVRPSHVDYLTRQLPAYGDVVSGVSDMVAPSGYKQAEDRPVANAPVVGGPASRIIRDTGGADMERARNDMLSETVRDALADAGMRPSDIQAVPSYLSVEGQQIPLMRDEQTTYQERTNTYADREISTTIRSGEWRARGADREKLVKDAMARARDRAEQDVLRRIPSSEQRRRTREAEAMAAR